MKYKRISLTLLLTILVSVQGIIAENENMQERSESEIKADSLIELGLITCGPGTEIYSLYGHTAIHYINRMDSLHPIDVAINYGVFNMNEPNFAIRFALGKTDYWMGVSDFDYFCQVYSEEGRWVKEQKLNLSAQNKLEIAQALAENSLPQNLQYRYNYFYDNCTTRARDILLNHPSIKTLFIHQENQEYPSYRELIHTYNEDYRWARFGNDILLGFKADYSTDTKQQQFLPERLMHDFDNLQIVDESKNSSHPLVSETITWVQPQINTPQKQLPSPTTCFLALLILTIAVTGAEWYQKKIYWGYDAILMTLCGLSGVLLFFMLFSEQPTVNTNIQLLLLNPLPLLFIPRMIKRTRQGKNDSQYSLWTVLICLFFIFSFAQQYAEGMYILASSLLIRNIKRLA